MTPDRRRNIELLLADQSGSHGHGESIREALDLRAALEETLAELRCVEARCEAMRRCRDDEVYSLRGAIAVRTLEEMR